jgi:hypothetical protein
MIPYVPVSPTPKNRAAPDIEYAGHQPDVAYRPADGVPFLHGLQRFEPDAWTKHLFQAPALELKTIVEVSFRIRDCPSLRPELLKEIFRFRSRRRMNKEYRRIGGVGIEGRPDLFNGLLAEDSA